MKWVGLTGGMGTGKSTVAQLLRERGFAVVDADDLARRAVAANTEGFKQVVAAFGTEVVGASGELDRSRLGKFVFQRPDQLLRLEKIIHPIVRQLALAERDRLAQSGCHVAFYDVPLLFEKNLENMFDEVILVYAPESAQVSRVVKRDRLSEAEVRARLAAQIPIEEKRRRADRVIDNSGTLEELRRQVQGLAV
ncbi:MAG: dephospho-CoA kinase [Bdellovibrionales bacterium]|nr:dephospho-CoA kinase [Bdellovibrionales bacterium]